MLKKGLWWPFVLLFALMLVGIHTLGWWTRQPVVVPQVSQSQCDPFTTPAARQHFSGQVKHWRAMVMQQ